MGAIWCMVFMAAPSADAGSLVRSSGQHVQGGHGVALGQHRQNRQSRHVNVKRVDKQRSRPSSYRHRDHKRQKLRRSRYAYGYSGGYIYRDYVRPEPSYRTEPSAAVAPYQDRPVTPKWVHVGSADGDPAPFGVFADGGLHSNCLNVKTEITVDGRPMDAFGEACLLADGTWRLKPAEETD